MDLLWLRILGPAALALLGAAAIDRRTAERGFEPPGFQSEGGGGGAAAVRRGLALAALALALWVGVFGPLGAIGQEQEIDVAALGTLDLFYLHGLFVAVLVSWYVLGFVGGRGRGARAATGWIEQFGFRARGVWRELGLGVAVGVAAWFVVLSILLAVGGMVWALGGEKALPQEAPGVIVWVAERPLWLRLAVSLSAGLVEETFFRGFLQPRTGIVFSSACFILAHLSYDQPLMLVGITLLSLIFALLVRWRQSIWAAVAAHFVFDGVQLAFVIPWLLRFVDEGGGIMPVA